MGWALLASPSCSNGDDGAPGPTLCTDGGGPVAGDADMHCIGDNGDPIAQETASCKTGSDAAGAAGAAGAGDEGAVEEPYEVRYSNVAADDDCKYDVSFTNSCVELGTPVTFTVTLKKRAEDDAPASGATPDSPEVFLADDPSHISPSNAIKAPEGPPGTYAIGPIVFDRSGRWVVRFHFFERCSDVPEDSLHGHVAFYVDVP